MALKFSTIKAAQEGKSDAQRRATAAATTFDRSGRQISGPGSSRSGGSVAQGGGGSGRVSTGNPLITPARSPVSTSDSARSSVDAVKQSIRKLADRSPSFATVFGGEVVGSAGELFDRRREALAERRSTEIARITGDFGAAKSEQKTQQRKETGAKSMGLARIGGFDSASGQAVLTDLERVHEGERESLIRARENAINQANQAFEDKDFELAKLQVEDARATEQMLYDRERDFISLSLQLRGEERADAAQDLQFAQFNRQLERDRLQDQRVAAEFSLKNNINTPFYFIGGVGFDSSTGEALFYDEYIARGGDPDFESNATVISAGSAMEREFVLSLASQFPDAPIDILNDDVATARAKISGSSIYQKSIRSSSGSGPGTLPDSDSSVRKMLLETKRKNPDIPWYDLWGQAADYLNSPEVGLNAENFDDIFWEVFHPEGSAGFKAEQGDDGIR